MSYVTECADMRMCECVYVGMNVYVYMEYRHACKNVCMHVVRMCLIIIVCMCVCMFALDRFYTCIFIQYN